MDVPEVRLVVDSDGEVPPYAVVKGPRGWYGVPGARKGFFLTDDDVKDAIPLQPGPAVLIEVGFDHDDNAESFADGLFDVRVNGKRAATRVPVMTAGTYVVSAAVQKAGEPIMVIGKREKPAPAVEEIGLTPVARPRLELVDTDDKPVG